MSVVVKKLDKAPVLRGLMRAKVKTAGNVMEVLVSTSSNSSSGCPCRRISADEYIDQRTGEVGEYDHINDRSEATRSFFNTLNRIRDLINANVTDAECCRFGTFTYAENMTDPKRLLKDWEAFRKRFNRYCIKNGIPVPEYIAVVEPQGRGAWHMHVVFIWQGKAPYISNNEVLEPLWRHGFTSFKAIKGSVDNVGAYFSAYLTDIPLDEYQKLDRPMPDASIISEKEFTGQNGEKTKKKFVKGARVKLYPPHMNVLRHSQGIKEPVIEEMTYEEAKEKVWGATQTYQTAFSVSYDTGEEITQYVRTYYNTAHRKEKEVCQTKCEEKTVKETPEEKRERLLKKLHEEQKKKQEQKKEPVRVLPRFQYSSKGHRLVTCTRCGIQGMTDLFQSYHINKGLCLDCARKKQQALPSGS